MNYVILDIPDQQSQWPDWLEKQIVGLHLRELVDELKQLDQGTECYADIVNEPTRDEIRQSGFSVLTISQIQQLFRSADTLLELQEDVFIHGGPYWKTVQRSPENSAAVERIAEQVIRQATIRMPARRAKKVSKRHLLLGIGAIAAGILIAVTLWTDHPRPSGWGLGRPELTAHASSSREFFASLAEGTEWFDRQPRDVNELLEQMTEVSNDFQVLIDSDHSVLTAQESRWFREKCQGWKEAMNQLIVDVKAAGDDGFEYGRTEAGNIMTKLINVLKAGPSPDDLQASSLVGHRRSLHG